MRIVNDVLGFYTYRDFLSNHYPAQFTILNKAGKSVVFKGMEWYIMYVKAMLFGCDELADNILDCASPQGAKLLGRQVKPYVEDIWAAKRPNLYVKGLIERYRQNPEDKQRLLDTHPYILAEATHKDVLWGCGIDEDDDRLGDPNLWTGDNLCGRGNQWVREQFLSGAIS